MSLSSPFLTFVSFLMLINCNDTSSRAFHGSVSFISKEIKQGDTLMFDVRTNTNTLDSLVVFLKDKKAEVLSAGASFGLSTELLSYGNHTVQCELWDKGKSYTIKESFWVFPRQTPKYTSAKVMATYPHSRDRFTQGLEFRGDTLYESTGKKGASRIHRDLLFQQQPIDTLEIANHIFGEGITIAGDNLVHLTWQAGYGQVYNLKNMNKTSTFPYLRSREGWGIAYDKKRNLLYKSDGSHNIWILDEESFTEQTSLNVLSDTRIFSMINELEYAGNLLWANVYTQSLIIGINPETGVVERILDCSAITKKETFDRESVLNGIAYHEGRNSLFITGKYWSHIYEIQAPWK